MINEFFDAMVILVMIMVLGCIGCIIIGVFGWLYEKVTGKEFCTVDPADEFQNESNFEQERHVG